MVRKERKVLLKGRENLMMFKETSQQKLYSKDIMFLMYVFIPLLSIEQELNNIDEKVRNSKMTLGKHF